MPHELGHLQGIEFRDILLSQMGRLKSKPTLRSALDFCNHSTSFTAGWKIVEG